MAQLYRHSRDPKHFEMLRVLDEFARSNGLSIDDEETHQKLIAQLSETLLEHRTKPTRLFGFRTEAMFAHVVAALGHCDIIVEEDTGIHYDSVSDSTAPDFRIITSDNEQFFVEVKNFHQKDLFANFKVQGSYLKRLYAYTQKFGLPLKIATFWSKWNKWTLVDSTRLLPNGNDYYLSIGEALARNEMCNIGDFMIGTVPPLSLRVYADPMKPREILESGQVSFTIGHIAFLAGETELRSELDQKISWFLFLYGEWDDCKETVATTGNQIDFLSFSVSPRQNETEQAWNVVGTQSSMISKQYLDQTSVEGSVKRLSPVAQPDELGVIIPRDFYSDGLRLWCLVLHPRNDRLSGTSRLI